jgi:hypothetical protein
MLVSRNFSDIVTFTRASSALAYNSAGVLTSYASNLPRLDYDPVTLAARGFLIEEQRTNGLLYSGDLSSAGNWITTAASLTGSGGTAPDGTNSATVLTANGASSAHYVANGNADVTGAKAVSIFAKAGTNSYLQIAVGGTATPYANFDLSLGTASAFGTGTTAAIQSVGGGSYRCSMVTTDSAAAGVRFAIVSSTSAARLETNTLATTVILWGAQSEIGAFATSYIPTTSAQVTRAADVPLLNTLSPWFNPSEGTLYCEVASAATSGATAFAYYLDDTTSNNSMYSDVGGGTRRGVVFSGGVVQAAVAMGAVTSLVNSKTAFAYKANDFGGSLGGGAEVVDTSGSVPTVTRMIIGNNFALTAAINGWLRKLIYYPARKPTQTLTA